MFANPKRLEPLTLLLSKILDVDYEELEGKIELYPLTIPNETIGKKKSERDDIMFLSAALYTDKQEECKKCIENINADKKVKKIIEEVSDRMNEENELKIRYVDFLEENKKINRSIIADERKEARKKGLKEGIEEGLKQGIEQDLLEGREQGIAEGIEQTKKEMIINMYNKNWDIKLISEGLNISTHKITEIINENNKSKENK